MCMTICLKYFVNCVVLTTSGPTGRQLSSFIEEGSRKAMCTTIPYVYHGSLFVWIKSIIDEGSHRDGSHNVQQLLACTANFSSTCQAIVICFVFYAPIINNWRTELIINEFDNAVKLLARKWINICAVTNHTKLKLVLGFGVLCSSL